MASVRFVLMFVVVLVCRETSAIDDFDMKALRAQAKILSRMPHLELPSPSKLAKPESQAPQAITAQNNNNNNNNNNKNTVIPNKNNLKLNPTLIGTFVADCQNFTWFLPQDFTLNVSSMRVLEYWQNSSYEMDYTDYVNDATCNPSNSDILLKWNMKGNIQYNGPNALYTGATKATWTISQTTWFFSSELSDDINALFAVFNSQCPCGVTWTTDQWITVSPSQCGAVSSSAFILCQMMAGQTFYGSYMWNSEYTYISSPVSNTQIQGWGNNLTSTERHLIPYGGDHNPADCDYVDWASFGADIVAASKVCDTCIGLECFGCLYHFLPESTIPDSFVLACPCLYYYGEQYKKPWMVGMNC